MILIQWPNTDASFNLAAEEYIFNNLDKSQDYLLLWQNRNAVIIGRHQNTIEEINREYVQAHDVQVVRRLSGGGAVYHDLGNLNYTLIINTQTSLYDFKVLSIPVVQALQHLGVNAEFTGRNDLVIDGKKISGAAQMIKQGRLLHHGTLLFHSDLDIAGKSVVSQARQDRIKRNKVRAQSGYEYLRCCPASHHREFQNRTHADLVRDQHPCGNRAYVRRHICNQCHGRCQIPHLGMELRAIS